MSCVFGGCHCEGRNRANWPMPGSPFSFASGDDLDRIALAQRLPAAEFDRLSLAQLLKINPSSVWTLVARGVIPEPDRYEAHDRNGDAAVWRAEQVVPLLTERAMA